MLVPATMLNSFEKNNVVKGRRSSAESAVTLISSPWAQSSQLRRISVRQERKWWDETETRES